jgi:hypothetical protein
MIQPTVINYAVNQPYQPIPQMALGVAIRLIPFFQFSPTPVPVGRHRNRPQSVAEFLLTYTAILSRVPTYDEAWVAQTLYTDCNIVYVPKAGIIYRNSNTFGIWAQASNAFTIVHPLKPRDPPEFQQARISSPGALSPTGNPPAGNPNLGD